MKMKEKRTHAHTQNSKQNTADDRPLSRYQKLQLIFAAPYSTTNRHQTPLGNVVTSCRNGNNKIDIRTHVAKSRQAALIIWIWKIVGKLPRWGYHANMVSTQVDYGKRFLKQLRDGASAMSLSRLFHCAFYH